MAVPAGSARSWPLHPLHVVFLVAAIPLFVGALASDIAYWNSYQVQWTNFASWLVAGGLLMAGIALVFAVIGGISARRRGAIAWLYPGLLLFTWLLGFINALVHARDAWASMPDALVLSAIGSVLICASTWIAFLQADRGDAR